MEWTSKCELYPTVANGFIFTQLQLSGGQKVGSVLSLQFPFFSGIHQRGRINSNYEWNYSQTDCCIQLSVTLWSQSALNLHEWLVNVLPTSLSLASNLLVVIIDFLSSFVKPFFQTFRRPPQLPLLLQQQPRCQSQRKLRTVRTVSISSTRIDIINYSRFR